MKHFMYLLFTLLVQQVVAQNITMSRIINGKKYTVTQDSKVYDSSGTQLPFEKWYPSLKEFNLVPLEPGPDSVQTYQLRPYTEKEKAARAAANEAATAAKSAYPIRAGESLQPFTWKDISGKTWSLAELKGKVLVFNFWFVDCAPCVKEIPELNDLKKLFADRDDIVFFAVTPIDESARVRSFTRDKPFDYVQITKEEARNMKETAGISSYPSYLVADKKGMISYFSSGYYTTTTGNLISLINQLLR